MMILIDPMHIFLACWFAAPFLGAAIWWVLSYLQ